ncbi:hypothetical protein pb186bvf_018464 [Paramecium bursaria]
MFKQKKRCAQNCYEHQFILQPKSSECWVKQTQVVDYCPVFNEFTYQYENIVPIHQFDRQPYLPAFMLELDRTQYQFNQDRYQHEHNVKIEEAVNKKQKMNVPKPGKKHRYCGVCKKNYEEYLDHVQSPEHVINFHQFRSVHLIKQLIVGFQGLNQQEFLQSSMLFCESNTKLPMNKENFGAYFDQERIGLRFQKPQDLPQDYKLPNQRRGRKQQKQEQANKKVKLDEQQFNMPMLQYMPYYMMDFYKYEFQQRLLQQQQQLRENEEIRNKWQRLLQVAQHQSTPGQDIVQLVQSIIESYENNPRYQQHDQPPYPQ